MVIHGPNILHTYLTTSARSDGFNLQIVVDQMVSAKLIASLNRICYTYVLYTIPNYFSKYKLKIKTVKKSRFWLFPNYTN